MISQEDENSREEAFVAFVRAKNPKLADKMVELGGNLPLTAEFMAYSLQFEGCTGVTIGNKDGSVTKLPDLAKA